MTEQIPNESWPNWPKIKNMLFKKNKEICVQPKSDRTLLGYQDIHRCGQIDLFHDSFKSVRQTLVDQPPNPTHLPADFIWSNSPSQSNSWSYIAASFPLHCEYEEKQNSSLHELWRSLACVRILSILIMMNTGRDKRVSDLNWTRQMLSP